MGCSEGDGALVGLSDGADVQVSEFNSDSELDMDDSLEDSGAVLSVDVLRSSGVPMIFNSFL